MGKGFRNAKPPYFTVNKAVYGQEGIWLEGLERGRRIGGFLAQPFQGPAADVQGQGQGEQADSQDEPSRGGVLACEQGVGTQCQAREYHETCKDPEAVRHAVFLMILHEILLSGVNVIFSISTITSLFYP